MDRRYRLELQMVRVPVVWRAKIPDRKLFPATRKVPEARRMKRMARAAAHMFFAQMMEGVPPMFIPVGFVQGKKPKETGRIIHFRRYTAPPSWEDE